MIWFKRQTCLAKVHTHTHTHTHTKLPTYLPTHPVAPNVLRIAPLPLLFRAGWMGRVRNEAFVAHLKVLPQYFPGGTEGNHDKLLLPGFWPHNATRDLPNTKQRSVPHRLLKRGNSVIPVVRELFARPSIQREYLLTYLYTYLLTCVRTHSLTPWYRILIEKLIVT
jgi:hypothetical protein